MQSWILTHTRIRRLWMASVLVVIGSTAIADEKADRPNILFIFSDDHAVKAISAYGSRINETPNIDRLAAEGMRFDHCLVTNSICGPSRAVIQTGLYSHLNGFRTNGDTFDGSQQTFPKLLQKSGYQTAVIGKWHLVSDPTGFDYWNILIGQGPYYNPPMIDNGKKVEHEGYTTEVITDLTLDWLDEKRDKSKPFMLMYQHKAPHREWDPNPKYFDKYENETMPEPPTLFDRYSGNRKAAKLQRMQISRDLNRRDLKLEPPNNLTPEQLKVWNANYDPKNEEFEKQDLKGQDLVRWKYQRYIKDYARCVAALDENLGRVLDYLDKNGLAENTIVVYASDQGWYLGDHGWFDKRWMYEESLHTPLIVRWPGKTRPGSVDTHLVSNLDFAETFLDAAEAEVPSNMQGRSLVPLLQGESPEDWRDSFYYHYYEYPGAHSVERHYGVRDDRYKLIHFYQLGEWELYDLAKDPHELNNVYGDPEYTQIAKQMHQKLDQQRELVQETTDE